mgnify:CR=1 FL=1
MKNLTSFISGLLFSLGLGISGMLNPIKVKGFLDLTRVWDPSLIFVMIGAIAVYAILFRIITKRSKPICEKDFSLPTKKDLDFQLITGSALFGIGWGIAGICPGPGIANLATGLSSAFVFVIVMVLSMWAVRFLESR